ncbi:hypothetical protein FRAHR75_330034 [Frankia sp. Hr75.2]|nr:hypothetical protein FRAHR75_330034 [Frankia sp. Hr75.2]
MGQRAAVTWNDLRKIVLSSRVYECGVRIAIVRRLAGVVVRDVKRPPCDPFRERRRAR